MMISQACVRAGATGITAAQRRGPPDRRGGVESHPLGPHSVGRAALQDRGDTLQGARRKRLRLDGQR